MSAGFDKAAVVVGEVEVRPVRADERRRWDALMDAHHYLGFRQFAGRGLRHVAEWRGHWVALLGWHSGEAASPHRTRNTPAGSGTAGPATRRAGGKRRNTTASAMLLAGRSWRG